jgi:DNA-binding transcriptional MerR regulator
MLIGEVAEACGTTAKTLRFYQQEGLLPAPERTQGGYRNYTPETLQRLDFIRRSRTAGLTLAQIREVLDVRDAGSAPCLHVQQLLASRLNDLDRQIAELQALRDTVAELSDAAATLDPAHCEPAGVCRYV